MGRSFEIPAVYREVQAEIDIHHALVRVSLAIARELLRHPPPDTFLGRQHYDLIPLPYQHE